MTKSTTNDDKEKEAIAKAARGIKEIAKEAKEVRRKKGFKFNSIAALRERRYGASRSRR